MSSDLSTTTLHIRFSLPEDFNALDEVEESLASDLAELKLRPEVVRVELRPADVGVGYSGPGFELALEVLRMATDDVDRLIVLGTVVLWVKDRVNRRRQRMTVISDEPALGAVAAASVDRTELTGFRFVSCRPLTGWPEQPQETDERFVWAAVFQNDEQAEILTIFMSPAGVVLGQVVVPLHGYERQGVSAPNKWRAPRAFPKTERTVKRRLTLT